MNFQGVALSTRACGRKVKTDNILSQSYTENSQKAVENRDICCLRKEKSLQKTEECQRHSKLETVINSQNGK